MRRALVIVIVLAVVVAASWFGYEQFGKAKAQAAPDYETVTVGRGDISSTVSATGSVLPEREANLNFQGAGSVAKVAVKAGDLVKAGQVLGRARHHRYWIWRCARPRSPCARPRRS